MLDATDVAVIKGMLLRGDKQHNIAAYKGLNAGRIAEIATGQKFADIKPAPLSKLPPPHEPRFINPNDLPEKQWEVLCALIKNPPENSRIITITPALAQMILDNRNDGNRNKRPRRIQHYAEAMSRKNGWVLSGDTVKFDNNGMLIDGQNRLWACVLSGELFRTHVVFGVDPVAWSSIDTNAVRTKSDTAKIGGLPYPLVSGNAVRWLMIYAAPRLENGRPNRGLEISNQELINFYRKKVDIEKFQTAVERAMHGWRGRLRATVAAHLYMFEEKSTSTARRFSEDLTSRRRVGRKLPDKLDLLRRQNAGRLHEDQVNALIIQAWNVYRAGETISARSLNWNDNKDYPTIT